MTQKEQAELRRLGRTWACGRATKAQMLRHTELARKAAAELAGPMLRFDTGRGK